MTTVITATATVKVRGFDSPGAAAAIAGLLGSAIGSALQANGAALATAPAGLAK